MEGRKSVTPSVRLTRIYKTCHWRFCLPSQQVVLPHTSWNKSVWLGCKSPSSRSVTQCRRSSGMAVGGWWIGSVRGSSRTWHIPHYLCTFAICARPLKCSNLQMGRKSLITSDTFTLLGDVLSQAQYSTGGESVGRWVSEKTDGWTGRRRGWRMPCQKLISMC